MTVAWSAFMVIGALVTWMLANQFARERNALASQVNARSKAPGNAFGGLSEDERLGMQVRAWGEAMFRIMSIVLAVRWCAALPGCMNALGVGK